MIKKCSKCKKKYPVTDKYFIKDNRRKFGLGYSCRECHREYNNNYYQKNHKRRLEIAKNYRDKNRDKMNLAKRIKRQNLEFREKEKEYIRLNKDRYNFYTTRRIAHKKGASGSHTFEEWEDLKKKYEYICPICLKKEPIIKLTRDHIIPISIWKYYIKEHLEINYQCNDIQNIQPLCLSCNSWKKIKVMRFMLPKFFGGIIIK